MLQCINFEFFSTHADNKHFDYIQRIMFMYISLFLFPPFLKLYTVFYVLF